MFQASLCLRIRGTLTGVPFTREPLMLPRSIQVVLASLGALDHHVPPRNRVRRKQHVVGPGAPDPPRVATRKEYPALTSPFRNSQVRQVRSASETMHLSRVLPIQLWRGRCAHDIHYAMSTTRYDHSR